MNFWQKCFPRWTELFSKKTFLIYLGFLAIILVRGTLFCQETEFTSPADSLKITIPEPWTENWLYKKVYPLIFKMEAELQQEQNLFSIFEQYSGKKIAKIYIVNLDVFEMLPDNRKHISIIGFWI